jgi:hypothetical protein
MTKKERRFFRHMKKTVMGIAVPIRFFAKKRIPR